MRTTAQAWDATMGVSRRSCGWASDGGETPPDSESGGVEAQLPQELRAWKKDLGREAGIRSEKQLPQESTSRNLSQEVIPAHQSCDML